MTDLLVVWDLSKHPHVGFQSRYSPVTGVDVRAEEASAEFRIPVPGR
jgi:hypothetical protein